MVSALAPRASPNARSAAAAVRQPIDETDFMSVPPGGDGRPRPSVFFAPAYHAVAGREGSGTGGSLLLRRYFRQPLHEGDALLDFVLVAGGAAGRGDRSISICITARPATLGIRRR